MNTEEQDTFRNNEPAPIKPDNAAAAGTIGLAGGQGQEEAGGLDISQYTGPDSKASTQFENAAEPYGTGPGSGIAEQEEASADPSAED